MAIKYTEEQLNSVDKSFLVQMFLNQQEEMVKATNQVELHTKEVRSLNKKISKESALQMAIRYITLLRKRRKT